MAIITFWSNGKEETAKTLSLSAIATYMAIEHNYKILVLSTNYNDTTLETCFFPESEVFGKHRQQVGLGSGIEELAKAIMSGKTSPEIITNYTKIALKDRLEILPGINGGPYSEYERLRTVYAQILRAASKYYDMIFVDATKGLDSDAITEVLEMSDLLVVSMTQRLKLINDYITLKREQPLLRQGNSLVLIGRYDKFSKYSSKNIARYMKEKEVFTVPYSTLYFEAANEGKVTDFFFRFRKINENDRNALFISEIKRVSEKIVYRLQEQQMRSN